MARINDLKILLGVFIVFLLFISLVSSEVLINYENKRYRILTQNELIRRKFSNITEMITNIFDTKLKRNLEKYYTHQRFIVFNIQKRPYVYEITDRDNDEVILFT